MLLILLALLAGCKRTHYRTLADRDAYAVLEEKNWCAPWMPPGDYSILPHPASRFFDPTPLDDPLLPLPAPQLYCYELPALPQRDPSRFRPDEATAQRDTASALATRLVSHYSAAPQSSFQPDFSRLPAVFPPTNVIQAVAFNTPRPPRVARADWHWQPGNAPSNQLGLPPSESNTRSDERDTQAGNIVLNPILPSNWDTIPFTCLPRVLEFQSIRDEYELTYKQPVSADQLDSAQRLSLEDIVDLAQINSREYQTAKETLYRAALRLSLERFDYQHKFSTNGHSTDSNYTHDRTAGVTVNTLSVPTTFSADKMLVTGGDFLARFANSVLLTFNGPQGFAADIGSDLLFDFSQSVFQRDVRFESLTQADRDVIYAARTLGRFRKTLFTQLADQYYSLLINYRQIEIGAQNYFSVVRTFRQAEAEFNAGLLPRLQVDLIEANVFDGLSALITRCNALEQALDVLKIRIGLPTETPVNLDLTELEQLTLRDELSVTAELIQRVVGRLDAERGNLVMERVVLLSAAQVLAERILSAYDLRERLGQQAPDRSELEHLRSRIQVEVARLRADEARADLDLELNSESPQDPTVFQRTIATVDEIHMLTISQVNYAERIRPEAPDINEFRRRIERVRERTNAIRGQLEQLLAEPPADQTLAEPPADELTAVLRALVAQATQLLNIAAELVRDLDVANGLPATPAAPREQLQQALGTIDRLGIYSQEVVDGIGEGLVTVNIGVDDAMLTALVLQFELMNERGFLADDWRAIKLAGDDLKSVLNLNAGQTIRTPLDLNRPFAFTFDESQTRAALMFDLPVNRRSQRNIFRQSLINYNAGLRQLMQREDSVKLAVRNDLRNLSVGKTQYTISVRSAALAFERLVSTKLEFLVAQTQTARDFSEAQAAYTRSLNDVATDHINYLTDRMQLFLDLELLVLDESGFWQELYDEEFQPEPFYQLPCYALPGYGELPPVWYSKRMKRMLHIPPGTSMIHRQEQPDPQGEAGPVDSDEQLPAPLDPSLGY